MAVFEHDPKDGDKSKTFRDAFGPGQIETHIRQGIQTCWMFLPEGKRNIDEVERQVRRIVDRVFQNLRDNEKELSE
jgi:hypothetical protein